MRIKKFLVSFLICIFIFFEIPQAQQLPIATTYTQGIYNISKYTGHYITARLITINRPITAIVINSRGDQKVLLRFLNPNEIVKLGPVEEGDILLLIGTGEISFTPF